MKKIVFILFLLTSVVLASVSTFHVYVIQKTHGDYILRFAIPYESLNTVFMGLKERGVPADSLWFFTSWTIYDTTGGVVTVTQDTILHTTVDYRNQYDAKMFKLGE